MGTSFSEYKNYGFWSNDGLLEIVLFLIHRELKNLSSQEKFLLDIIEKLHIASTAGFVGCIPNHIDKFDTPEKLNYLRQALLKVIAGLKTETYLTVDSLNESQVGGGGQWQMVPMKGALGTAELMLKLIDGELKTDASSKIDYWTFLDE